MGLNTAKHYQPWDVPLVGGPCEGRALPDRFDHPCNVWGEAANFIRVDGHQYKLILSGPDGEVDAERRFAWHQGTDYEPLRYQYVPPGEEKYFDVLYLGELTRFAYTRLDNIVYWGDAYKLYLQHRETGEVLPYDDPRCDYEWCNTEKWLPVAYRWTRIEYDDEEDDDGDN